MKGQHSFRAMQNSLQADDVARQVVRHEVQNGQDVRYPSVAVLRGHGVEHLVRLFGLRGLASVQVVGAPQELGENAVVLAAHGVHASGALERALAHAQQLTAPEAAEQAGFVVVPRLVGEQAYMGHA
jgi:hypothetical protein